jgi:hypothetical protein
MIKFDSGYSEILTLSDEISDCINITDNLKDFQ